MTRPVGHRGREGAGQALELLGPAHERRVQPARAPVARAQLHEPTAELRGLRLDQVPHQALSRVVDQRLARARQLLEALGCVHGVSARERLAGSGSVRDHLARADPHPGAEPNPERQLHFLTEPGERLVQLDRRAHGSKRVVLVQQRDAEHRHENVPGISLDRAAVALEHSPHCVEIARADPPARLGVEGRTVGEHVDHTSEHDGHRLTGLLTRPRRHAAPGRGRDQLEYLLGA
jgi:hypothetical protein